VLFRSNECWIADRDRFSYEALNSDARLTAPMIKQGGAWKQVDWTTALEYIATAGLGALMASFNEVKKAGGNIILAGMSDKIKKVFDTMGFSKVFKIVGTVPEAKSAL